jgi:hypothetical protein
VIKVLGAALMLICLSETASAQSDVTNVRVQERNNLLYVTYDLAVTANIEVCVSFDGGVNYGEPL